MVIADSCGSHTSCCLWWQQSALATARWQSIISKSLRGGKSCGSYSSTNILLAMVVAIAWAWAGAGGSKSYHDHGSTNHKNSCCCASQEKL